VTTDALLAITHHVAVFSLLAVLAIEWGLLRSGLGAEDLSRLRRYDLAYGIAALAVVIAGVTRVLFGAVAESFYLESVTFWLKMASFAAVGLLSIVPTVRYLRWSKAATLDPPRFPTTADVAGARRFVAVELALFLVIPSLAALMARGIGS
jgi:putative membrane protein